MAGGVVMREHTAGCTLEPDHGGLCASVPTTNGNGQALADARAVGRWYGTTHGNELDHDHHCPVPRWTNYGKTSEGAAARAAADEKECTCGWAKAEDALARLADWAES